MHPAIGYLNYVIYISINNDDLTLYNTKGVNYDFFLAAASMEFDILDFKLCCLNSIESAEISEDIKEKYKIKFEDEWRLFCEDVILSLSDLK